MSNVIPEGWVSRSLLDCSVGGISNGVFCDPKKVGSGYKLINVYEMYQGYGVDVNSTRRLQLEEKVFKKNKVNVGDIFFTRSSLKLEGIAQCNINLSKDEDITYDGHLMRVIPNRDVVVPDYLARYCLSDFARQFFMSSAKHSTMTTIGQADIAPLPVLIPPLPEQKKIAAILASVDDVIEKTQAQIDKLKNLKTGMMQELLTRGVGVGGKPHTEFKALPKWHTGRISEISEIPANWELVTLSDIAKLESGHTPSRDNSSYWGGEHQWVSLHDTKQLNVAEITKTKLSITQAGLDNSSARILPKGTVFFSRTASVGNCVIAGVDMATSQDFANYICGEKLHNKYLYHLFSWMQHVWKQLSEGSTHKTIYMPVFKKLQILLPPLSEQVLISQALDSLDTKLGAVGRKLESHKRMKKALMQDLLTGKVRVKVDS